MFSQKFSLPMKPSEQYTSRSSALGKPNHPFIKLPKLVISSRSLHLKRAKKMRGTLPGIKFHPSTSKQDENSKTPPKQEGKPFQGCSCPILLVCSQLSHTTSK